MRKLILTAAMALAMTALMATSASAAVEVRNGNGELCATEAVCEVTFDGDLEFTPGPGGHYTLNQECSAEWTVEVYSDGYLELKDAEIDGSYLEDHCETFNGTDEVAFCWGDHGGTGNITQQGDDDYVGPGHTEPSPGFYLKHYNAVIYTCWHTAYDNWGSLSGKMRFDIDDHDYPTEYDHLEPPMAWTFDEQLAFTNTESYPAWVREATLGLAGDHQLPPGELIITSVEE